MNKSVIGAVLAVVVILVLGGVFITANKKDEAPATNTPRTSTNTDQSPKNEAKSEAAAIDKVDIKDFAFAPAKITVKKGTTVTWTNRDSAKHDVTPDNPTADFKAPEKLIAKDEGYTVTFNNVGTFTYFCSPHPYMKGSVEVIE